MSKSIVFTVLVVCFIADITTASFYYGSVFLTNGNRLTFVPNVLNITDSLAYGTYNDTIQDNGWGILDIKAGYGNMDRIKLTNYDKNRLIMEAAGFLEGYLTAERIQEHAANMYNFYFVRGIQNNKTKEAIINFLNKQDIWARNQSLNTDDPLWRHASYVFAQYDGLIEGYNNATLTNKKLRNVSKLEFDIMNDSGDLLDLQSAVNPSERPNVFKMNKYELDEYIFKTTHCSALIKITPGYENIFMSHSSWFTYQAMLRVFKHYDFNLDDPSTSAKGVSFSSYPGQINSLDDFYIMSNKLVMIQTTNGIFDTSIYDFVTPESLLAWHRVRIANMMASTGAEWGQIISFFNSGTYNNQYMVLDLSKIKLNDSIGDNALWVAEQIPGLVVYEDQTDILRAGYWPSYNVPFYEKIYIMSGYPDIVKKFGPEYSYQLAPRAKIFRRDQTKVSDMDSMKKIMRYNNYMNEEYSDGDSCKTICCRGDITGSSIGGCYDTKVTDYLNAQYRNAFIINGPTTDGDLPPFSWSKFPNFVHIGMPETFNFSFILTKPSL